MEQNQILEIMPRCPLEWAQALCAPDFIPHWQINTPLRWAAFLSQLAVENDELTQLTENLNYSESSLLAKFPTHFDTATAKALGRNEMHAADQMAIANHLYANRFGNGDEQSGDGWKYRGRVLGLTFRDNYRAAGLALKLPLDSEPSLVELPYAGRDVAGWFWHSRGLNLIADEDDLSGVTLKITGGSTGLSWRQHYYERAKQVLL